MSLRRSGSPLEWVVSAPRHEQRGSRHRVVAHVGGSELWFESDDVILEPAIESFAGSLLLPALAQGAQVQVEGPLDAEWVANTRQLPARFAAWWGYDDRYPISCRRLAAPEGARATDTGGFFTLGIDSFYLLVTRARELDVLVYVHGFDTALRDAVRMAAIRTSLEQVGSETGKRTIVVRTNFREHPLLRRHSWGQLHGAGLAAVAQLLAASLGRIIIPSSASLDLLGPWGSHPETDPLWSSSAVAIGHDGLLRRRHKIQRLVGEGLVRRHLRVCWENRSPSGNCSRCEKCVRTMVALAACGELEHSTVFDRQTPLPALIDAIPAAPPHLDVAWEDNLELDPPEEVAAAIGRLLRRTRRRQRRWGWLWPLGG